METKWFTGSLSVTIGVIVFWVIAVMWDSDEDEPLPVEQLVSPSNDRTLSLRKSTKSLTPQEAADGGHLPNSLTQSVFRLHRMSMNSVPTAIETDVV